MFALVDNPRLKPVVEEAERRLRRVVAALAMLVATLLLPASALAQPSRCADCH